MDLLYNVTMFRLDLPMAPSTNHMYFNTKRGRTMTPEARAYKDSVIVLASTSRDKEYDRERTFGLIIIARVKRASRDASNIIKIVEDAIFEGIGVNDSHNHLLFVRKVVDDSDTLEVYCGYNHEIADKILRLI